MNSNCSRPSGAKPLPIGRGAAPKPTDRKCWSNEMTVRLCGFAERKMTSPFRLTVVREPPSNVTSDLSLTPRYLHDARSDDNRQPWSRASPLGTLSVSRHDCTYESTRWIREISIYSVCRSDYCEQPRATTSATPSTTSPRTSQMRSYLSTVGSQCGGTRRSRSPR